MSSSVDTRVVQMQFDNASFEKGVAQTMASLDGLSKKLDSKQSFSGLDGLRQSISKIDFGPVGHGLDSILDKASSVFGKMTGLVSGLSKSLVGISGIAGVLMAGGGIFQAITGGAQRATNIENARFQLKGLGADWKAITDDINYAVADTAYGFDEAATAAAQFTASGIEAGESMKTALRSVSGIAAMTNSDYSSIAHIMTTVAGQGQLMTMQLRQLEMRGLNAAAILGEQMGYTEAEIRDFVSAGVIDFQTFAYYMDQAFGEHAKEANETFTGAVANMKAALNKIGADFMTPIHELERQSALSFRLLFNSIREGLNTAVDIDHLKGFGDSLEKEFAGANSIVGLFALNMGYLGEDIYSAFEKFTESGVIQKFVSSFAWVADAFSHGTWRNISAIITTLFDRLEQVDLEPFSRVMKTIGENLYHFSDVTADNIPLVIDIFADLITSFLNVAQAIGNVISPIFSAFMDTLANFLNIGVDGAHGFLETLHGMTENLVEFTGSLKLSAEDMESVKTFFSGLFSGIGSAIKPVIDLLGKFGASLWESLQLLIPVFASFANSVGNTLSPIFSEITSALGDFLEFLGSFVSQIPDFISQVGGLQPVTDFFNNISEGIGGFVSNTDAEGFSGVLTTVSTSISDFKKDLEDAGVPLDLMQDISNGINSLVSGDESKVSNFFSGMSKSISESLPFINKMGSKEGISGVADAVKAASFDLESSGSSVIGTLKGIGDKVAEFIKGFDYQDFITALSAVATGLMLGTGIKFATKFMDLIETVSGGIKGLSNVVNAAAGVLYSISGAIETFAKSLAMEAKAELIKSIGISIALLAGSLFLISLIDSNKLGESLKALALISLMVAGLMLLVAGLSKWMTKDLDAKKLTSLAAQIGAFAAAMGAIAAAVAVLALSVGLFSLIDPARLGPSLAAVMLLLIGVAGVAAVLGHIKTDYKALYSFAAAMLSIGLAIIPLAAAIALFSVLPMERVALGIAEVLGMVAVLAITLNKFGKNLTPDAALGIFAFATAVLAIGLAIMPLVAAVIILGALPFEMVAQGLLFVALALISVGVATSIIGQAMTPKIATSLLAASVAIAAFGAAILGIAAAVALLSAVASNGNFDVVVDALTNILAAFGLVGALLALVGTEGDLLGFSASLMAFGVAVLAIAAALSLLAIVPVDGLIAGVVALSFVLAVFLGIGALLGTVLEGAAGALVVFATAILLTGVGVAAMGVGLLALASGLALLAAIGPAAAESIGSSMVTMAGKTAEAINTFMEKLAGSAPQLKNSTVTLGKSAAEGFAEVAPSFGNAGVQAILGFVNGLGQAAGALAAAGLSLVVNLLAGVASGIGQVVDAAIKTAMMFIIGVADGLRENVQLIELAIQDVFASLGNVILTMLADLLDAIGLGFTGLPDMIRGGADELAKAAEDASQQAHAKIDEAYGEILDDTQDTVDGTAEIFEEGADTTGDAGGNMAGSLVDMFGDKLDMLPEEARGSVEEMLGTIGGLTGDSQEVGELLGDATVDGAAEEIEAGGDEVEAAAGNMMEQASHVDASGYGSSVGDSFGAGVNSGISNWIGPVIERAREMIRQAKDAANAEQAAASPAKELIKVGSYFALGVMVGIMRHTSDVVRASTDMMQAAMEPTTEMANSMSSLLDGLDLDGEVVITPLLDTGMLEREIANIPGLFPETQLVGFSNIERQPFAAGYSSMSNGNTRYGDEYHFNLNYNKSNDGTDILMDIARYMKTRNLMGA